MFSSENILICLFLITYKCIPVVGFRKISLFKLLTGFKISQKQAETEDEEFLPIQNNECSLEPTFEEDNTFSKHRQCLINFLSLVGGPNYTSHHTENVCIKLQVKIVSPELNHEKGKFQMCLCKWHFGFTDYYFKS